MLYVAAEADVQLSSSTGIMNGHTRVNTTTKIEQASIAVLCGRRNLTAYLDLVEPLADILHPGALRTLCFHDLLTQRQQILIRQGRLPADENGA